MRQGNRETIPSVEEAVRDAVRACDPRNESEGATALLRSFEGDTRPATASDDLAEELRSSANAVDPDRHDPTVMAVAATAHWLATNPSAAERPDEAIRKGVRLFYGDPLPDGLSSWLDARGVD